MGRMSRRIAKNTGIERPATSARSAATATAEPAKKPGIWQRAFGWLNRSRVTAR